MENICVYLQSENQFSHPMLFWTYCKNIQTYFGYFRHTCLFTTKKIVSTCRILWCLSACRKKFTIPFFTEIFHLKEPWKYLGWQHVVITGDSEFARYEIGVEILVTIIVFILDYFQEKLITKFKETFFGAIGSFWFFLPKFGQNWIFLEKSLCQFLNIPIIYHHAKNQEKVICYSWGKCCWMNGKKWKTDNHDFFSDPL